MKSKSNEDALLAAKDAAEAVKRLYAFAKQRDKRFSMAFLAKRAGMSSSGYFSDLVTGRRKLRVAHCRGLANAFGLGAEARQLLRTLAALEHETCERKRAALERRRDVLRKALGIGYNHTRSGIKDLSTMLEVFCAFGLFSNEPTLDDLVTYFGVARRQEVKDALATLKDFKMIDNNGDQWRLLKSHVIFSEEANGLTHIDFLKSAMAHACSNVEAWFPHKRQAYFTSSIISVDRSHYEAKLEGFRSKVIVWQSDLESGEANMLVRCNVQVYPIAPPPAQ